MKGLENAPGWSEVLASESEAIIKADQYPEDDIIVLQQRTIQRVVEEDGED